MRLNRQRLRQRLHWRWTPARSCELGVALTLLVALLDVTGALSGLELNLYDKRAYFQNFTPAPIDRIVHLDIDDPSIETIGRWPWPRSTQAEIIDEVRLAGADVLALDIIFSEPQEPTTTLVDGTYVTTDHDAEFAAAVQRFGRVLVPVFFGKLVAPGDRTPSFESAVSVLRDDPTLDEKAFAAKLPPGAARPGDGLFVAARRAALSDRIAQVLSREAVLGDDEVRRRVFGAASLAPDLSRQFDAQLRQARAVLESRRFSRTIPTPCPPLLRGTEFQFLPEFCRAARYSGFVDIADSEDGVVRGVPLWVEHDGRLYPQFGLAIACAALRANPAEAKVEADRVTVPLPNGEKLVVPVRTTRLRDEHASVGTFFDIPWFGWKHYETMYDPLHQEHLKQHVPITLAWGLAKSRRIVTHNNTRASQAIERLSKEPLKLDLAVQFLKDPPAPGDVSEWLARAEPVAARVAVFAASPPEESRDGAADAGDDQRPPSDEELQLFDAARALQSAVKESRLFVEKAAELRKALGGKIVLVGSTATAAFDRRPASVFPDCPGIVIHGAVTHALLTGAGWRFAPPWVTQAITVGIGLLVTITVTWLSPWKALIGTLLIAATYALFNCLVLFDYGDRIVGLAAPLTAVTLVWGMLTVLRFVFERAERARITKKFRGYVDPQLVSYIEEHPEKDLLEGEVKEMTVCFTDLAGFTTMAERIKEQAVPILGRYISRMVRVMRRHRGFMNRLMGDGIMFSYGAPRPNPNHAVDAVTTVLEMQEEMTNLNRELAEEGLPQLAVRGGVSTGNVVVGDSGGAGAFDYTCLGDVTNFGARLESANKYTGTKNLISARTAELLGDRFLLRPVALLQVAGKTQSVMTYEPLAATAHATDEQRHVAELTRAMVDHYQAARFAECRAAADALEEAFPANSAKLAKLYRDTAARYESAGGPPDGFRGEIVLTEK